MSNPSPDIASPTPNVSPTPNATPRLPNGALQKLAEKALYKIAIDKVLNTFLSTVQCEALTSSSPGPNPGHMIPCHAVPRACYGYVRTGGTRSFLSGSASGFAGGPMTMPMTTGVAAPTCHAQSGNHP